MLTLLTALLLALPAQVDVFKVAPAGQGTHVSLQAAIDDASDGDVILIDTALPFDGTPTSVHLDGLGLTLVGDGDGHAALPVLVIENLPADSQVVLRQLAFQPTSEAVAQGGVLALRDCAGAVLIEDCRMHGADGANGVNGGPALFLSGCDGVSLVRSSVAGGAGVSVGGSVFFSTHGGRGLRAAATRLSVHDTTLRGGDGGDGGHQNGGGGALGLDTQNADLWLVGSSVVGGSGGTGSPPGTGSFGAQLDGFPAGNPALHELDSTFVGAGGMPGLAVIAGTHEVLSGEAVQLRLPGPVRPGDSAEVQVEGPAGTLFGLFLGAAPGYTPLPSFHGVLIPELASFTGPVLLTSIPATGLFSLPVSVPAVGVLDGFVAVGQVLTAQPGGLVLSNASAWVQVESGL